MIQQLSSYVYIQKAGTHTDTCILMFLAALFTTATRWKQPKHPLTWLDEQTVVFDSRILLSFKKEGHSDTYYSMGEP